MPGSEKPLRLSWSQLRTHEECHAHRALQAAGHRSGVANIRNFFPGTVVDRCMRAWLDSDELRPGGMSAMVDDILDTEETTARETGDGVVRWRSPGDKSEVRDWCRELVSRLEPLLRQLVVPHEYQPAVRFVAPLTIPYLDGSPRMIELSGELDLLTRLDQLEWNVWDLKGTQNPDYWRKVVGQLVFYEIAVFLLHKRWPARSGLIQPMCEQPVLVFQFTDEQRRDMLYRITKTATDIWRGDASPKVGSQCGDCNVRHACPAHPVQGRVPGWP